MKLVRVPVPLNLVSMFEKEPAKTVFVGNKDRWLYIIENAIEIHEYFSFKNNRNERVLTHWGRVTHICVSKQTIIGSDNGLSPGRRQAIIWTNAGILLIGPLGTNFNETSIEIHSFSFKKINFKMSSGKWRPSCLGLNVLTVSFGYQNKYRMSICQNWSAHQIGHHAHS